MPLVTWNVPVLNGMPYLQAALRSIAEQSFHDAEVLAWDNGSMDGSVEVLRQWIPARVPGRVVTGVALPLGECRARMILESHSEFVALMDADDMCNPVRLETQIACLQRQPKILAVGTQIVAIDTRNGSIDVPAGLRVPSDFCGILHRMMHDTAMVHPTLVLRRSAVIHAGNYSHPDPINSIAEDSDLLMRLAANGELASLDQALYTYRFHDKSTCQNPKNHVAYQTSLDAIFAKNSLRLFGWTAKETLDLRRLQRRFALPLLLRALRHIESRTGSARPRQVRTSSFAASVQRLTRRSDLTTRAAFSAMARLANLSCRG